MRYVGDVEIKFGMRTTKSPRKREQCVTKLAPPAYNESNSFYTEVQIDVNFISI